MTLVFFCINIKLSICTNQFGWKKNGKVEKMENNDKNNNEKRIHSV